MFLSHEQAKIQIYILTRAELLITFCYKIPCMICIMYLGKYRQFLSNFTFFLHLQLDVHFDNQVLRLASVNCEAEILLKIVLQKKIDLASATASVDISQKPTKIARIGESHQYFACILRNHGDEGKKTYFFYYLKVS